MHGAGLYRGGGYYRSANPIPLNGAKLPSTSGEPDGADKERAALVTGGTGMVGGAISRLLLERGDRVRILVRQRSDAALELEAMGAEIVLGDVTDRASLAAAVDGCADVYHCAALVDPFHWDLDDFDRINVEGTRNVLDAALASGVRRFLHMSSIAALGAEPGLRADEFTRPYGPWKPGYGRSKFESEELVRAAAGEMHAVTVNPAIVFGPGDRHFVQLINAFVRGRIPVIAFADRPMPLVYADDVARGSLLALERGESGQRYILAQPTVTIAEFFLELAAASGRRPPRVHLPDWLAIPGALAWSVVSWARRKRSPVGSFRSMRIGAAEFDGGRASRELGLEYTDFRDAVAATVSELLRDG
jgi:dihydroflavonol-4-reductase